MKQLGFDLIFLGSPASGKDTQARLLLNHFAIKRVESGIYFRRLMKRKDALGQKVRATVGSAKPAPVSLMKMYLANELKRAPKNKDLVFVGNPKLKPEAQFLVKMLKAHRRDFFVIYIKLPRKEIYKRSFFRMRHDDLKRVLISRRIKWHEQQVGKTVKYFDKLGKLKVIKGDQSIIKVSLAIHKAINDYARSKRN